MSSVELTLFSLQNRISIYKFGLQTLIKDHLAINIALRCLQPYLIPKMHVAGGQILVFSHDNKIFVGFNRTAGAKATGIELSAVLLARVNQISVTLEKKTCKN